MHTIDDCVISKPQARNRLRLPMNNLAIGTDGSNRGDAEARRKDLVGG